MRMRRRIVVVTALSILALGGFGSGSALAHWFGSNRAGYNTAAAPCANAVTSQCVANNGTHFVRFQIATSNPMYSATLNRFAPYDATDVTMIEDTCDTCVSTDVEIVAGNYGDSSWWAYGTCVNTSQYGGSDPDRWCIPQVIFYNTGHPSDWDTTLNGRKTVACHELGHTLGLRHSDTTCMRSGALNSLGINDDQRSHLNGQY